MTESISAVDEQPFSLAKSTGLFGHALFWLCIFSSLYSPIFATKELGTDFGQSMLRSAMLLIIVVLFFAISRKSFIDERFFLSRAANIMCFILMLFLPVVVLLEALGTVAAPLPFVVVAWVLWGIGAAYFMIAWTVSISCLTETHVTNNLFYSFAGAGCLCLGLNVMVVPGNIVILLVAQALSLACILHFNSSHKPENTDEHTWMREQMTFRLSGSYVMLIDGVILGVAACIVLSGIRIESALAFLPGAGLAVSAVSLLALRLKASYLLSLEQSQLVFLPVIICGLLFVETATGPARTLTALIIFAVVLVFEFSNCGVLSLRGLLLSVSPSFCYTSGRIFILLGQAIGWLLGGFLLLENSPFDEHVFFTVLIALFCCYIAIAARFPDKFPLIEAFSAPGAGDPEVDDQLIGTSVEAEEIEAAEAREAEEVKAEAEATEVSETEAETEPQEPARPYKKKCSQAAENYGLTPKETEVLFYLAKGRNAKFISDQLFIAERTTKTHIYHIYQKMGIHSQQELINIVETGSSAPAEDVEAPQDSHRELVF